jgi:hypothetical protein
MIEKADDNYEISMFDIISLYPYCNFTGPYPLGHPTIITPDETRVDWTEPEDVLYEGLLKVRVIPPKGLYLPQIPTRIPGDDRLLFTLCIPCAKKFKEENTKKYDNYVCPHSDKERAFTATLTHLELKEALFYDYKVTHCYRAWHYENWSDSLFKGYVQLLMKLKIESSDFPSGITTQEEKEKFAKDYKEMLGIEIDISKVALNPGMRFISVSFSIDKISKYFFLENFVEFLVGKVFTTELTNQNSDHLFCCRLF